VGNLAVGGTGKSPMVEYLIDLLQPNYTIGTLSRGYKRKTKGYVLANEQTTALDIGDEPMQFYSKYPNIAVAVGEERLVAIPQLLHDKPNLQAIILDDAFQHRSVKAGLNILLTEYSNLYTNDFFLPTGDLRDERSSAKRAQVIVVTKCPANLSAEKKQKILDELHPKEEQKIFFTTIEYGAPYHIITKEKRNISNYDEILLVCGIANPKPLKEFLTQTAGTYYQRDYSDHHIFSIDDLNDINNQFRKMDASQKFILTTEKDAVRLIKFANNLKDLPLFVLPIRHAFLFNEGEQFNRVVASFISNFYLKQQNEQKENQE
jgi:tetraacyldisaccharide 4'-kinase